MTPPDTSGPKAPRERSVWVYAVTKTILRDVQHSGSLQSLEHELGVTRINSKACDLIEMPGTPPDHLRRLLADYYGITDRALQPHSATLRSHDCRVAILTEEACSEVLPSQLRPSSPVRFLIKLPVHNTHIRKKHS